MGGPPIFSDGGDCSKTGGVVSAASQRFDGGDDDDEGGFDESDSDTEDGSTIPAEF